MAGLYNGLQIDDYVHLLESTGYRKIASGELKCLSKNAKKSCLKVSNTEEVAIRLESSRHYVQTVPLYPLTKYHQRLFQRTLRPSWSIINSGHYCNDSLKALELIGFEILPHQRKQLVVLYDAWSNNLKKSMTVSDVKLINNQILEELSSVLLESQSAGVFIVNVAWNGGFSSFALREDTSQDLGLNNAQLDRIRKYREKSAKHLQKVSSNTKEEFLKELFNCLDATSKPLAIEVFHDPNEMKRVLNRIQSKIFFKRNRSLWVGQKNEGVPFTTDDAIVSKEFMKEFEKEFGID